MPCFITHHLFGLKLYHSMEPCTLQDSIQKYPHAYSLGLQGPDLFFFYLPGFFHTKTKNIGSIMHVTNTGSFFLNYMKELSSLSGEPYQIALTYLAGFLGHYYLDVHTHPYIYSITDYKEGIQNTNPYYSKHRAFESQLDAVLLYRVRKELPSKFNKAEKICLTPWEKNTILSILKKSINKTYHDRQDIPVVTSSYMERVYHSSQVFCQLLLDKKGHKKKYIRSAENWFTNHPYLSSLLTDDSDIHKTECLNLNHNPWTLGWAPFTTHTESFLDLYHCAYEQCLNIFYQLSDLLGILPDNIPEKSRSIRLLSKQIGNYSYHTGQTCE